MSETTPETTPEVETHDPVPVEESSVSDALDAARPDDGSEPGNDPEAIDGADESTEVEAAEEAPVSEPQRKAEIRKNMRENRSNVTARRQHDKYCHLNPEPEEEAEVAEEDSDQDG